MKTEPNGAAESQKYMCRSGNWYKVETSKLGRHDFSFFKFKGILNFYCFEHKDIHLHLSKTAQETKRTELDFLVWFPWKD